MDLPVLVNITSMSEQCIIFIGETTSNTATIGGSENRLQKLTKTGLRMFRMNLRLSMKNT